MFSDSRSGALLFRPAATSDVAGGCPRTLFHLLDDDQSGEISIEEFVQGPPALRPPPVSGGLRAFGPSGLGASGFAFWGSRASGWGFMASGLFWDSRARGAARPSPRSVAHRAAARSREVAFLEHRAPEPSFLFLQKSPAVPTLSPRSAAVYRASPKRLRGRVFPHKSCQRLLPRSHVPSGKPRHTWEAHLVLLRTYFGDIPSPYF